MARPLLLYVSLHRHFCPHTAAALGACEAPVAAVRALLGAGEAAVAAVGAAIAAAHLSLALIWAAHVVLRGRAWRLWGAPAAIACAGCVRRLTGAVH